MLKSEIQKKLNEAELKLSNSFSLTGGKYLVFYCADCGNPFILNNNQYNRRYEKGKIFSCAAGHENVFKS